MKNNKVVYTKPDEPLVFGKRVYNLGLPSPEELALCIKPKGQKVTITLDPRSVEFFKNKAKQHGTKYQSMIRELITQYASSHS